MDHQDIQKNFLNQLKAQLPSGLSLADALSESLFISQDSAYRRTRGETSISIQELKLLADKYNLSLDGMLNVNTNTVSFYYNSLSEDTDGIINWLQKIDSELALLMSFDDTKITYIAKDIPVFHLFQLPELMAFKSFFWSKSIAGFKSMESAKFSLDNVNTDLMVLARQLLSKYNSIPTDEIWCLETVYSMISQIIYYQNSGFFSDKHMGQMLLDKVEALCEHVQSMAAHGNKYLVGKEPTGDDSNYKLFVNELVLPENTILVNGGPIKACYLSFNVMNFLITRDPSFAEGTQTLVDNLRRRSTLISTASEKDRNMFFTKLQNKISEARHQL